MTERTPGDEPAAEADEPAAPPAAEPDWGEPTQPMDAIELEPDEAASSAAAAGEAVPDPALLDPASAIESLFAEDRFREYESTVAPSPGDSPFARRPVEPSPVVPPRARHDAKAAARAAAPAHIAISRTQKILLGVLGGLLALLALLALFLLGTRIAGAAGPAPALAASPSPSATPATPDVDGFVPGPVAAGAHDWDELLGGECLDPYTSPWEERFTVVDCAEPHAAQLVFRGLLANADGSADYPGADSIAAQIAAICAAPGVVDLATAGVLPDAQVQGSYPVDEEQWDADPAYACFVTRESGESITGSIAVPQTAAPTPVLITALASPAPDPTATPTTP